MSNPSWQIVVEIRLLFIRYLVCLLLSSTTFQSSLDIFLLFFLKIFVSVPDVVFNTPSSTRSSKVSRPWQCVIYLLYCSAHTLSSHLLSIWISRHSLVLGFRCDDSKWISLLVIFITLDLSALTSFHNFFLFPIAIQVYLSFYFSFAGSTRLSAYLILYPVPSLLNLIIFLEMSDTQHP